LRRWIMRTFQIQGANFSSCANSFLSTQVNLAIMQKQLSEMAVGHPRQSGSCSHQNGFSGGVGALGIMNNRLAETSMDR
ncbi:Potassium channel subfamily K member 12, partial [Goodea atripinnis]